MTCCVKECVSVHLGLVLFVPLHGYLIACCDTPVRTGSSKGVPVLEFLISVGPSAERLTTKAD